MSWSKLPLLPLLLASATWPLGSAAAAPPVRPSAAAALEESHAALERQEHARAIDVLEEAADHGQLDPSLSFNRGLAYLGRSASPLARPGDHGQAAAAFEETLLWAPDDREAERGLEEARLAVARRRARSGNTAIVDTEPLSWRALSLFSPRWLFTTAAAGSLLATLGLFLRASKKESRRLAATMTAAVGGLLLFGSAAFEFGRRTLWSESSAAVVVTERASLLDGAGRPLAQPAALLEGQSVRVRGIEGKLARIAGPNGDLWVLGSTLRVLTGPPGS